jgi:uncharacterized spore protein YtfJ
MTDQPSGPVGDVLRDTVGRIPSIANADAVVGPMQEKSGRIAIPLANVAAGFGLGLGSGVSDDDADASGRREGGGGGARSRPVAVVELTDTDLQIHQVVDSTRIAVASLALAAWCVYWITHTIRAFRRR